MKAITIESTINADAQKVWKMWTEPQHIEKWNQASPDWECPHAENDVRVGGRFLSTMAAKDGSAQFDFTGTYTDVMPGQRLAYTMDDGRKADVTFTQLQNGVHIVVTFDMETMNSEEMQRAGWQAILDSYKHYVESN